MSAMDQLYFLRLQGNFCTAEVWLNGVPACRIDSDRCLLEARPVHEFLLPGKNHLALLITPGPLPSQPMQASSSYRTVPRTYAEALLVRAPEGVFADDPEAQPLARVEWRPEIGTEVRPPLVLEARFDVPVWWPSWSWTEAQPVSPSLELDRVVFQFVSNVFTTLRTGDPSFYMQAAATHFEELAKAYSLSPDVTRGNFLKQWAQYKDVPLRAPVTAAMSLRSCAGGRLIECLDTGFEPMLRAETAANGTIPIRFPIGLSFFGNEIRIVR